jgi:Flp pilus assembly pilin Flp
MSAALITASGLVAVALISGFVTLRSGQKKTHDALADTKTVVNEIKISVDGRLDNALNEIKQLKQVIAALLPKGEQDRILNGAPAIPIAK